MVRRRRNFRANLSQQEHGFMKNQCSVLDTIQKLDGALHFYAYA